MCFGPWDGERESNALSSYSDPCWAWEGGMLHFMLALVVLVASRMVIKALWESPRYQHHQAVPHHPQNGL